MKRFGEVTVKNVALAKIAEIGNGYDLPLTLLGSSTWGDDEIEFREDFGQFYEEMGSAEIRGKKIAIFGCGDSSYEFFCGAIDLLQEKVGDLGGVIVNEPLRIDDIRRMCLPTSSAGHVKLPPVCNSNSQSSFIV